MIKNKEKHFDCIKMKNNIQKQIYAEIKHMSDKELLLYFNSNKEYQERKSELVKVDATSV
ncbi:MAG: hypothetical protein FWG92_05420 [Leptospirales bacterium]|nr:hypothetical protein [Leptospirales bacterium]